MTRIAFIGAGSLGFTRNLVRDILTFPLLRDSTLVLMDINPERLAWSRQAVQKLVDRSGAKAKVEATTDRRAALRGADAVLCTILAGGVEIFRHDLEIPKKYGIDTNVGDTRSISGIFRALRTIPVMLDIVRDMERYCPDAILLNYSNPMAMLCRAMQRSSPVKVTGLCHSVQGTASMLAKWIGATDDQITYVCAGINHQAFYVEFNKDGKDAYPLIRKAVARKEIYQEEIVRNEMFLALGYYVTESSGHNSEYNWWFRKRQDLIKKYCLRGTGWNPGVYAAILKNYLGRQKTWKTLVRQVVEQAGTMSMERGREYAAYIINAWMGGDGFLFNGNVPNDGIIDNLPAKACVEVPVLANKRGFNAIHVGPLPPQCVALVHLSVCIEEMAVEAAITGDPTLLYQACCYDPLCAAVLGLREIKQMVQEMLKKNKPYLPQFKNINIA